MRIGSAFGLSEPASVDQVAAVDGKSFAVAGFRIFGTRLGVLAGNATHANNRLARTVNQHEAHLQHDFQFANQRIVFALVKVLSAVAALQQERFSVSCGAELIFKPFDFPTGYQWRQQCDVLQNLVEFLLIVVNRLLNCGAFAP